MFLKYFDKLSAQRTLKWFDRVQLLTYVGEVVYCSPSSCVEVAENYENKSPNREDSLMVQIVKSCWLDERRKKYRQTVLREDFSPLPR